MSILVAAVLLVEPVTLALKPRLGDAYRFAITKSMMDPKNGNYSVATTFDLSFQDASKDKYLAIGKFSDVIVKGLASTSTETISKKQLLSGSAIRFDQLGPISLNVESKTSQASCAWSSITNHPVYFYYPEKPVRVGDKWQRSVSLDSTSPHEADLTSSGASTSGTIVYSYQLAKLEGGAATVSFTVEGHMSLDSTIFMDGKSPESRPFSMQLSRRKTIEGSGEYQIDVATGLPTKGQISVIRNKDMRYPELPEKQTVSFERH